MAVKAKPLGLVPHLSSSRTSSTKRKQKLFLERTLTPSPTSPTVLVNARLLQVSRGFVKRREERTHKVEVAAHRVQ